jgi:Lysylphosphatidylglycerol synthase TM region
VRTFQAALLIAGALCLALLVERIGARTLWEDSLRLGWGAVIIVAVAVLEHAMHTAGWQRCFSRTHAPSWPRLFGAFLAGYAVSFATPATIVGGEVARGGVLLRDVPTVEVVASITLDRLAYAAADLIVALCGVAVIVAAAPLSGGTRAGVAAAAALVGVGVGTFFWLQRRGRLAAFLANHAVLRRIIGKQRAERFADGGAAVDRRLAAFHANEPGAFGAAIALHAAGTAVGALQIAIFLGWLGVAFQGQTVLKVFLVATAIDLFSFLIPLRLGAQEGGRMLGMSIAGLDPALGLLFALVIRLEQIVWAAVGFVLYLALIMARPADPVRSS